MGAERTALALSGGDCRASQGTIIQALKQFEGVAGVKADLIPDHLLIDHAAGAVTGDALAALINTLTAVSRNRDAIVHYRRNADVFSVYPARRHSTTAGRFPRTMSMRRFRSSGRSGSRV